jgi:hypothetical protein
MATPAGFEDRPPHRGTFFSVVALIVIQPCMARTAAAQHVFVTHAASVADAVEEFEDMDRHLASAAAIAVNDVAQVGGARRSFFGIERGDDGGQSATASAVK